MCREDIRIGRMKTSAHKIVTAGIGANSILVNANKYRTHLSVCASAGAANMQPTDIASTSLFGYNLAPTLPPVELDIEQQGLDVCGPWNVTGGGAGATIFVVETFFTDGDFP